MCWKLCMMSINQGKNNTSIEATGTLIEGLIASLLQAQDDRTRGILRAGSEFSHLAEPPADRLR